MPITPPQIDDRRYDDLVAEALARVTVHTPEWRNFNRSDPGVTLIEVFAFLTESLLYRVNLYPERMRLKFLQRLRIPLHSATDSRGLVTIANTSSSTNPEAVVLTSGLEVRAGEVPFRTSRAVDVLPVEGRLYFKKKVSDVSPDLKKYYQQLYASYRGTPSEIEPQLYESAPFPKRDGEALSLNETIDNVVWLALLVRENDVTSGVTPELLRTKLAHRTLSLGVAPSLSEAQATLPSGRAFATRPNVTLRVDVPKVGESGGLPDDIAQRRAEYRPLEVKSDSDLLAVPGVADITLPDAASLRLWNNIDPLEAGVNDLPPAIEDPAVEARLVTWLRISLSSGAAASFLWMGINATPVTQRVRVTNELLPDGTGEPDQTVTLALAPVLNDTVRITVTHLGSTEEWLETKDLMTAGAEVPVRDPRLAPGAWQRANANPKVFLLNAESGEVRFGDGLHGARPPEGATLRATYDYALGAEGNVGALAIDNSPALPEGFRVANPIPTWGGAEAESVDEGEKQIARYLQHRDRLVTAEDFATIAKRTPGVEIARVEVLPNFHPDNGGAEVPGVVTLMLIPAFDPEQPDAPLPRRPFLDAVCRWLDPRRLVTTEIVLRGPNYRGIWISIGVKVAAGFNDSEITESVKAEVVHFLNPSGWKLGKSVIAAELAAVANRTRGVEFVQEEVVLADANGILAPRIDMTGLQLPRILGIRITNGAPATLDELRGGTSNANGNDGSGNTLAPSFVQIPTIPKECQ